MRHYRSHAAAALAIAGQLADLSEALDASGLDGCYGDVADKARESLMTLYRALGAKAEATPEPTVLIDGGNAYAIEDGLLMTAAVLMDGRVDGTWGSVELDRLPPEDLKRCVAISDALGLLNGGTQ